MTAFRSTLEADWAATLDYMSVRWAYEPRTLHLPSGKTYIPDFWLPEIRTWLEVKGDGIPGLAKTRELAQEPVCGCAAQCDCEGRGGVMVIAGFSARYAEGMRYGTMRWADPLAFTSFLSRCPHCDGWFWMRPQASFRCRRCMVLDKAGLGHLYSSAGADVEFYRADRHDWTEVG
jgi:hypothetical protein